MKKILYIIILSTIFFLVGCGSSSPADPIYRIPEYTYSGSIYNLSDKTPIYNTEFVWNDNSTTSFVTDMSGNFDMYIYEEVQKYYTSFKNGNNEYSVFLDSSIDDFTGPYVYINDSGYSFLIDNTIEINYRDYIWVILLHIVNGNYSNAVSDADSRISDLSVYDLNGMYHKYLLFLKDMALLKQDFDNIDSINPPAYFSYLDISDNYYTQDIYYGGMMWVMKVLLGTSSSKTSLTLEYCITFLEKIRADELDFVDNNMKIFGMTSDDIKGLLLLAYIYKNDTTGINKFSTFDPETDSYFAQHIKNMYNMLGY